MGNHIGIYFIEFTWTAAIFAKVTQMNVYKQWKLQTPLYFALLVQTTTKLELVLLKSFVQFNLKCELLENELSLHIFYFGHFNFAGL